MRRALAEDFAAIEGVRVVMTLDARLPDEPGPWEVGRGGPGEEPDAFARLAAGSDGTLCIAPETGGVLEARARTIEQVGGRSLGSSPEAVSLCGDKLRLADHLLRQGIDTPPSVRVFPARVGLPRDHVYPAVLKPIDGAGSIDTFYVESHESMPGDVPEALLQPFVPGRAMSAAFVVCPEVGPILIGLADQTIERVDGRFAYVGGVAPSRIGRGRGSLIPARHAYGDGPLISSVRSVPGLLGWVGVDFVWDEATGRVAVLEINPRATTSYVGFRAVESPGLHPPSWIAKLWLSYRGPSVNPWCRRVSAGRPVAFSADGRLDCGVVPS